MPNPDSSVVLDLTRLQDVYEDDTEGMLELFDMMLKNSAAHLDALDRAVQAQDLEGVRKATHSIKGSSGNVGANQLSRTAAEVEDSARDGNWENIPTLAAQLRPAYERAREAVEQFRRDS
jgi:HPt (histidine-containing phosphotransfer) domain-containing protein